MSFLKLWQKRAKACSIQNVGDALHRTRERTRARKEKQTTTQTHSHTLCAVKSERLKCLCEDERRMRTKCQLTF